MDVKQERPRGTRAPGALSSRVLGLTGGIGSGKNAVADVLASLGAEIIDADRVSRDLVEPGSLLLQALVDAWGPLILDPAGRLDRATLAGQVFGHADQVARLNALTHPAILSEIQRRITASTCPVIVVMAPLLFEAGADGLVDEVWVVRADAGVRLHRLQERDALSEEQGRQRLAAQMAEDERAARADIVIDNEGDLASLRLRVQREWQTLQATRVKHGNTEE